MSVDRHDKISLKVLPHRTLPPTAEEIFGRKEKSAIEVGMLQMQILWLLDRKPTHGYEIMDILNRIKSTKVTQGTLYPALKNLRKHGYIKGQKDGDKIIYQTTAEGKKTLNNACLDFTRTFFGIFQDFVCHKCVGHNESVISSHKREDIKEKKP